MSATDGGNGAGGKSRRPVAAPQGGPAADHRPGSLRRRHQPDRASCGRRWSARPRRTRRSSRSTRRRPRRAPACIAVYTNEDLDMEAGLPMAWVPPGVEVNTPDHWVLAKDAVKHVGDPVALVIGTDRYAVVDAAEDVIVEYDPLPVVTDPETALEDGSPLVHEQFGTNKVYEWSLGGGDLEAGFAEADVIVERRVVNHRIAGAAIEPRGVLAEYRAGKLTVWSSTQVPHFLRLFLSILLGISEERVRVDRARGRRRLRLQAADLRRGDRLRVGVAQARTPGEVDRDALRGHDGHPPRARPDRLREDRRQARRHAHGVAHEDPRRPRRLPDAAHADDPVAQRVRDVRRLQHAGRPDGRHRRDHEQVRDGRDPRSRAARGDPHDRGHDGPARRRAGHGPAGAAAQELHPAVRRTGTRPRSASSTTPATTRRRSTSCSSTSTRQTCTARRKQLREQGIYRGIGFSTYTEICGNAPSRVVGPSGVRPAGRRLGVGDGARPRQRVGHGLHRHLAARPGSRDGLRPDRRRPARRRPAQVEVDPRRHRHRPVRTRHVRLALAGGRRRGAARAAKKVADKAKAIVAHQLEAAPEDIELRDGKFSCAARPTRA